MDTFKINIRKTVYDVNHESWPEEYQVYANRGREFLFFFYKSQTSDDVWYFHLSENGSRELFITSKQFPVEHILGLAKAVLTVRYGIIDLDVRLTAEAKRTLKIK
jgi:hypothetical protein